MARYIKANPKVAKFLHLENDRNQVKDGNYLLWQQDMLEFGPLTQLSETLEMIGGLALLPHEAREEQDGTVTRPLPRATDERFVIDEPEQEPEPEPEEQAAGEGETQQPAGESEQPGEAEEQNQEAETEGNGETTEEAPTEEETPDPEEPTGEGNGESGEATETEE